MARITIYLDDEVLDFVKSVTNSAGISQSQWIAEAIRRVQNLNITDWY